MYIYKDILKPVLDFFIALILLVILSPILLIATVITIVDLGFPVYNRRRYREGKNKKTFIMYKLRTKTMPNKKNNYTEEYTKISKIIDKLRINELPQLINVLKGDMALVGPRPFIPGEKLPEGEISPKRYMLKPGLTGMAQVHGGRAITHKEKLKYDEIYYDNISFFTDLKIILSTVIELLFGILDR